MAEKPRESEYPLRGAKKLEKLSLEVGTVSGPSRQDDYLSAVVSYIYALAEEVARDEVYVEPLEILVEGLEAGTDRECYQAWQGIIGYLDAIELTLTTEERVLVEALRVASQALCVQRVDWRSAVRYLQFILRNHRKILAADHPRLSSRIDSVLTLGVQSLRSDAS